MGSAFTERRACPPFYCCSGFFLVGSLLGAGDGGGCGHPPGGDTPALPPLPPSGCSRSSGGYWLCPETWQRLFRLRLFRLNWRVDASGGLSPGFSFSPANGETSGGEGTEHPCSELPHVLVGRGESSLAAAIRAVAFPADARRRRSPPADADTAGRHRAPRRHGRGRGHILALQPRWASAAPTAAAARPGRRRWLRRGIPPAAPG